MDFKRIEAIFLVAFLCLDIFLFSIYRQSVNDQTPLNDTSTIKIEQRLKDEKIKFSGQISSKHQDGYYLSATQTNLSHELEVNKEKHSFQGSVKDNVLTFTPDRLNQVSKKKQIQGMIEDYLSDKQSTIFGKDYQLESVFTQESENYSDWFACQQYEGLPINDMTAQIKYTVKKNEKNYTVEKVQQMHLSNLTALREKMQLVSQEDALTTLYVNNKLSKNDEILWSELAYTLVLQVRGKNVYVPAWFVAIRHEDKKEQIEIVNAFRNRIITNSSVRKVENK